MDNEKQKIASDICPYHKEYGTCEKCKKDFEDVGEPCYFGGIANIIIKNGYRKQIDGEWVLVGNGNGRAIHWKCSICNFETLDASNGDTNFCPNCGAKM